MLHALAILLIGFSVFSTLSILLTHFSSDEYTGRNFSRLTGIFLLLSLGALQSMHFLYLRYNIAVIHSNCYGMLLFLVAPLFYLYMRSVLYADNNFNILYLLNFLPVLAVFFLPFSQVLPLSFAIGILYLLWLIRHLYLLRKQRDYFHIELGILSGITGIAIAVVILGLMLPLIAEKHFFALYSSAIGFAFLLLNLALTHTPRLSSEISAAASEVHRSSSLSNVDCPAALRQLAQLMEQQKLYQNPRLSLRAVADALQLSTHQLSELINTRLGKGFSRYIREQRITLAKKLLLTQPSASVLSIGLEVGFSSQSAFYQAFNEIEGTTPGRYRQTGASDCVPDE